MRYVAIPADQRYYIRDNETEQNLGWVMSEFMANKLVRKMNEDVAKNIDTEED